MYSGILDSGQKIVTNGLVLNLDAAQLRSYPTSGTTWTDLSGQGNNGTLVNGVGFNSDNGGGLTFDGVNDYVSLSNDTGIGTSSFTCESIVSFGATGNINSLFSINYNYPNSGYLIRTTSNYLIIFSDYGSEVSVTSNWSFELNTIYHITIVQNHNNISIYINSQLDKSSTLRYPILNTINDTYIGRRGVSGAYLNGTLYKSQIYNRALSATEVLQNYNATKSRFGL